MRNLIHVTHKGLRKPPPDKPPTGAWVVYWLSDEHHQIIYVGMSRAFSARLRAHKARTPDWVYWLARQVETEEQAAAEESAMIRQHQPRLNALGK